MWMNLHFSSYVAHTEPQPISELKNKGRYNIKPKETKKEKITPPLKEAAAKKKNAGKTNKHKDDSIPP